jgi:hypothetical protein
MKRFVALAVAAGLVEVGWAAQAQATRPSLPALQNRIPAPQPRQCDRRSSTGLYAGAEARRPTFTTPRSSTHSAIGLRTALTEGPPTA